MRAFRLHALVLAVASLALGAAQSFAQTTLPEGTAPNGNLSAQGAATISLAIPEDFVAGGSLHRVLVRHADPVFALLSHLGAVLSSEDYDSFSLLLIDAQSLGGVEASRASASTSWTSTR